LVQSSRLNQSRNPKQGAKAEYGKVRFANPAYRPDGVALALEKAKWVGMSAATYHQQGNFVFNEMTGVLPAYRRRGIALALKLLVIRFARAVGAAAES